MLQEINPFLILMLQILSVFAIVLIITKSSILNCKRQFVINRYIYSKQNGIPCFLHTWWFKMWTCAMCLGFWISIIIVLLLPIKNNIILCVINILAVFGANWLLHCLEELLFYSSEYFKVLSRNSDGSGPET
jgi:hypothetical protein